MPDLEKSPTWFPILCAVMLVWNLMGVVAYIAQVSMTPEALTALSAAEQELYATTPVWANGAFAVAVWAGAAGCVLLLLKRSAAFHLLVISLAGVAVQMFHSFFMSKSYEIFGPGGLIMPIMVIVIASFLVWLSIYARNKAWLR
jgi:hypothetical protein